MGAEATPDLRGLEEAGSGERGSGGRDLEAREQVSKGARGSGLGKQLEAGGVGVGVGRSKVFQTGRVKRAGRVRCEKARS
jgi:hypothetical protein